MNLKSRISGNFSKAAKSYDENAKVQQKIINNLIEKIKDNQYLSILEIGCGTGTLTKLLLENFKEANITAVDISSGMIERAKEKIQSDKVTFILGDVEQLELEESYDLIISTSTFQWIKDLDSLIIKLKFLLNEQGTLAFSTFLKGTFKELDYAINRAFEKNSVNEKQQRNYLTAERIKEIINKNFTTKKQLEFIEKEYKEYFPKALDFFKSIKAVGANNSEVQKYINPKIMRDIVKIYDEIYKENKLLLATYKTFIVIIK
ncbi:MAG: malonyl-ACP O-methyltransferase BioC [Sarcina sp.]